MVSDTVIRVLSQLHQEAAGVFRGQQQCVKQEEKLDQRCSGRPRHRSS